MFEYDAQTGSLVRVSIGQNGYNDNGNTDVAPASIRSPSYYGSESDPTTYWSRTVGVGRRDRVLSEHRRA